MDVFFIIGLFVIAYLYASVGHGGASGYLALMALYGVAPETMKTSALVLNLFVSLIAFIIFFKSGFFRWRLLFPFVIASMPFAFLGASLDLSPLIYRKVLGICLLIATVKILLPTQSVQTKTSLPNIPVALFSGSSIGFVSGMIGIGGGIILSPLLIIARWANIKESASISSAFIFLNSAAGLAGLYNSNSISVGHNFLIWTIVALIGGLTGSYFGAYKITFKWMKYILSMVLVFASCKLFLQ
jgi:uncharacterized protein